MSVFNEEFLQALLKGNRELCSKIVHNKLNQGISFIEVYDGLIKTSMYRVGELWEYNKISVATEHLASAIVESILNEVYSKIIKDKTNNHKIVISCIENEYHQIGLRMVNDVFEKNGWETFFLGANTPVKELLSFAKIVKPDVIAISLSIYFHIPVLQKLLEIINIDFPDLKVLVGGQAFNHGGIEIIEKFSKVTFCKDLKEVEMFIKKY